jgi:hypothetical protein
LAVAWRRIFGLPESPFGAELLRALTVGNTALMAINLLPIRPADGAVAWPVLLEWIRGTPPPKVEGLDLDAELAEEARDLFRRLHDEIRRERRKQRDANEKR